LFGDITDGAMRLNEYGHVVQNEWTKTADLRPNVELDYYVSMPNHFYGIIVLTDNVGARQCLALNSNDEHSNIDKNRATRRIAPTIIAGSIGAIIGQFKSVTTKQINRLRNTSGNPVWQRNYYEHIIRDEAELNRIREYIVNNPAQWVEDEYNPKHVVDIDRRRGEAGPRPVLE